MKLLLSLLTLVGLAASSLAADVTFSWDSNPTEEKVTHYIVYEVTGPASAPIFTKVGETPPVDPDAGQVPATTVTITGVQKGVHRYTVVAVNLWGESDPAGEKGTPPSSSTPKGFSIQVRVP